MEVGAAIDLNDLESEYRSDAFDTRKNDSPRNARSGEASSPPGAAKH